MSQPVPRPRPPGGPAPDRSELQALVPDREALDARPVREHVAVFEELHDRLTQALDDAD